MAVNCCRECFCAVTLFYDGEIHDRRQHNTVIDDLSWIFRRFSFWLRISDLEKFRDVPKILIFLYTIFPFCGSQNVFFWWKIRRGETNSDDEFELQLIKTFSSSQIFVMSFIHRLLFFWIWVLVCIYFCLPSVDRVNLFFFFLKRTKRFEFFQPLSKT